MNIRVVLLILAVLPGILNAQDKPLEFSLAGAQEYALQHNKTLQNSRDDVKLARAQLKEARGMGLPTVEGTVDYMTNFNYEAELDFGGGANIPPITHPSFDQGDLVLAAILDQMVAGSGPTVIVMEDQASANIQVSQLLFSGQYWVGIQLAKIGQEIREKSLSLTELEIKEQVSNTYYLALVTEELLRVLEGNEKNLLEVHQHTSNMYKAGIAEQTDVDQIKINLSQIENSKRAMERNLQLNYTMLRFLLGVESDQEIKLIEDLDELVEIVETQNYVDTLDILDNPTYQIMQAQENIGRKSLAMQKWSYAPTLVGFYSYKEKLLTTGFDLSPKNAAGLSLSVPIIAGGTKNAKLSQAKIELDKTSRNKVLLEEQLGLQNNQLLFEHQSAQENYFTQKENVEVAKRVYKSYNNKYQQGTVSSLELTQANSNYLMAENNYVASILSLLQARLKLDKLYNKL